VSGRFACPSNVILTCIAVRRGRLPLQDLIRDLETDDIDQQILCVGAGRCAGPRPTVWDCLVFLPIVDMRPLDESLLALPLRPQFQINHS
jgi:hypothetical protein